MYDSEKVPAVPPRARRHASLCAAASEPSRSQTISVGSGAHCQHREMRQRQRRLAAKQPSGRVVWLRVPLSDSNRVVSGQLVRRKEGSEPADSGGRHLWRELACVAS